VYFFYQQNKSKIFIEIKAMHKASLNRYWNFRYVLCEKKFEFLKKILEILKPLALRGKELSKAKATLLTSEGGFKFMFRRLRTLNTDPSQEMLVALKQRVSERKNKDIVSLMKYLQGSNIPRDESYEDFSYSTKPAAILLAKDLIKRIFSSPDTATISNFLESTPTTS
jgi:hypothetical protein